MKHALIFGLVAAGLVGCPVMRAKLDEPKPPAVEPEPVAAAPVLAIAPTSLKQSASAMTGGPSQNPRDYEWLCNIDGGRHCHGCPATGLCPQENSGPLCCVGDTCVVWSGSHCSGVLGWCFNYSKEIDPASGVEKAVCHDE